jgi:hypothetical protein
MKRKHQSLLDDNVNKQQCSNSNGDVGNKKQAPVFRVEIRDSSNHRYQLPLAPPINYASPFVSSNTSTNNHTGGNDSESMLVLGRMPETGIVDRRMSRKQVEVLQKQAHDDFVFVRLCTDARNPSCIVRSFARDKPPIRLRQGEQYVLYDQDQLLLMLTSHAFTVHIKELPLAENCPNYLFYRNKIPSVPEGALIDDLHAQWFADYDRLEARKCSCIAEHDRRA